MIKHNIFYYIFILSIIVISCDNNEIESSSQKGTTKVATKAYSTSLEPGAIMQIARNGIPVYIKNGSLYLSINAKNDVILNSEKQAWEIPYPVSVPELDNPNYEDHYLYLYYLHNVKYNKYIGYIDPLNTTTKSYITSSSKGSWQFDYLKENNCYRIVEYFRENGAYPSPYKFLSKFSSSSVVLNINENNGNQLWKLQPVESYTLESLSWKTDPEDVITALPEFIQEATVINNSSAPQTMTATYTKSATESSNFSETQGASITMSASTSVGVPLVSSGKIETSVTSSQSWQYGSTQSQQDQRSYSFPLTVPPNTTLISKVMVQMNKLTATYIATFRGETSGLALQLEGKWEGVQAGNIYYEIRDKGTNTVLKRLSSTPKATVSVTNTAY